LGIAGTLPDDAGDSAGVDEPDAGAGAVVGADAGAGDDPDPAAGDFALPRDDEDPSSLVSEVGASGPQPDVGLRLVRTTSSMAISIQTDAVITVTRVKVSPALVPNALDPPTPPKAPASPPPLPRWINIKKIKNSEVRMIRVLKIVVSTPTSLVLR
jgi:hypothetical protein